MSSSSNQENTPTANRQNALGINTTATTNKSTTNNHVTFAAFNNHVTSAQVKPMVAPLIKPTNKPVTSATFNSSVTSTQVKPTTTTGSKTTLAHRTNALGEITPATQQYFVGMCSICHNSGFTLTGKLCPECNSSDPSDDLPQEEAEAKAECVVSKSNELFKKIEDLIRHGFCKPRSVEEYSRNISNAYTQINKLLRDTKNTLSLEEVQQLRYIYSSIKHEVSGYYPTEDNDMFKMLSTATII
jgi:hypothetical protein